MPETLIPVETIQSLVYVYRNHRVMLDSDLAKLYGVSTGNLNKAVKRNIDRFPDDFMFQLTDAEWENLKFQTGISSSSYGGRRSNPYVFTEQGVAMLSSVLNSERAIKVNIEIMRAFVRMRELMATHQELFKKLQELEARMDRNDQNMAQV